MGYRSDVLYVAEFEDEQARNAAWAAARLKFDVLKEISNFNMFSLFEEDCIVFEASSIKWYDTYPQVAETIKMFTEFFNEGFNANVKFVHIGEDLEDVADEIIESPDHRDVPDWFYDQIYIQRTLVTPWRA